MSSEQHNNKLHPSNPIFPKINSLWPFSGTSHNQSQIHPLDVSDTVDTVGSRKAVIGGSDLTVPPTPNSRCSTQSNRSDTYCEKCITYPTFTIVSRELKLKGYFSLRLTFYNRETESTEFPHYYIRMIRTGNYVSVQMIRKKN